MEMAKGGWQAVTGYINDLFSDKEPWQIVLITCGTTVLVFKLKHFLIQDESLQSRVKKTIFRLVRKLPSVKKKIEEEMAVARLEVNQAVIGSGERPPFVTHLPSHGLSQDEVIAKLKEYQTIKACSWKDGYVSGCVYSGAEYLKDLGTRVYNMFSLTNPLHPGVFPEVRKIEAEIVRMCCSMFHGGPETCGTTTSGGTESLLLACLAYRNRAYEQGITHPEMIVSINVHAAFDKASECFRIKLTKIPLDPVTRAIDVAKMKRAINSNTCMLVCSAPDYPYGQIDPIAQVSELGLQYKIPVHVDACLGGFLIAFMDKAGFPLEPFDFRLPGITSISCDTHKYGFAGKGTSVILYRDREYRKYQFCTVPEWPGGIYATPTMAGSRGGALIAICWATMMMMGDDGYIESARKIVSAVLYISKRLSEVPELKVIGNPRISVVAIESDIINMYQLSTCMVQKGYHLTTLQRPAGLHIMVTARHTHEGVADRLVADIKVCIEYIHKNPQAPTDGQAKIYGMAQDIPDQSLVSDVATMYLDALYTTEYPS